MVYLNKQPLRIQLFHYADIWYFEKPAQIPSDNGIAGLPPARGLYKTPKNGCPTLFEDEPLQHGIVLINSRPHHLQTNGKLERFFRTLEEELPYYDSVDEYIGYYESRTRDIKRYKLRPRIFKRT